MTDVQPAARFGVGGWLGTKSQGFKSPSQMGVGQNEPAGADRRF